MDIISMQVPELPLPAINCVLTFRPYLKYIEEQIVATKSDVYRQFLQSIANLIRNNPELLSPIQDINVLDRYPELIELIKITHLSQVKTDGMLYTLGLPSVKPRKIDYFGYSDEFKTFFNQKGAHLRLKSDVSNEEFQRNIYREIMQKAYGINNPDGTVEIMLHLEDNSGLAKQFYKVIRRHHFVEVGLPEGLPELKQEWVDYASGIISSHKDIKEPLPFERFVMEGFFIFSVVPDTEEMAIAELSDVITQIHVNDDRTSFERIKQATLSLLGNNDIEVGFLPFLKVNGQYVYHNMFTNISVVFGRLKGYFSAEELGTIFNELVNKSCGCTNVAASMRNDVYRLDDDCDEQLHIRNILEREGLNSLKFVPVWHKNELLGIIEIGSKDTQAINVTVLHKLEAAIPFYREYFIYKSSAFAEYMKSFIMQRYTAIQDSVSWKFNEEVWNKFKSLDKGTTLIDTPAVRFENLYPFYGAIDFRNSSLKQIEAIHADYKAQLDFLRHIISGNNLEQHNPIAKELLDQVLGWIEKLNDSIHIEEEVDLRHFLEIEATEKLRQLSDLRHIDKAIADEYENGISSKDGAFHAFHAQYESSLQSMNTTLKEQLYKAEQELQEKIPHYFEKFQTDGIEYSLYAGNSIDPSRDFPANAVETIVDWQMDTMMNMALAAHKHKPELVVPLETTQLILVHENKVDISYRIDERHFDVEGSYSIRYEVVKKRIDKVHLFNSEERLTLPGTIAIVYTHRNSINPYLDKIDALTAQGLLQPGAEYLDLEQLQGIGKLKAIRVKINFETEAQQVVAAEQIMELKD